MKMTKLFTTVFDEELKARGFKRKARLYYRLNGDILQGIVIKPINPYSIHFYAAPYWMDDYYFREFPIYQGYWAENGGGVDASFAYYREENEQFNLDIMNICFTLVKDYALPVLDRINNLDSYIENNKPNWNVFGQTNWSVKVDPANLDDRYSYIKYPVSMHWFYYNSAYDYTAFLKYACDVGDIQKGYDLLIKKEHEGWQISEWSNEYPKYMTEDGLERAKEYFEKRRQIMIPRLRDELGLDTFNL